MGQKGKIRIIVIGDLDDCQMMDLSNLQSSPDVSFSLKTFRFGQLDFATFHEQIKRLGC